MTLLVNVSYISKLAYLLSEACKHDNFHKWSNHLTGDKKHTMTWMVGQDHYVYVPQTKQIMNNFFYHRDLSKATSSIESGPTNNCPDFTLWWFSLIHFSVASNCQNHSAVSCYQFRGIWLEGVCGRNMTETYKQN